MYIERKASGQTTDDRRQTGNSVVGSSVHRHHPQGTPGPAGFRDETQGRRQDRQAP